MSEGVPGQADVLGLLADGGNEFLSGGLVLMVVGAVMSVSYALMPVVARWLMSRFTVSIEVRDDDVFVWLGDWMQSMRYGERCRRLSVDVERIRTGARTRVRLVFAPGRGSHFFVYGGRWFWLNRRKEKSLSQDGAAPKDVYVLRSFSRDPKILKDILRDAALAAEERRKGKVAVYTWDRYSSWKRMQLQAGRGLDSVILAEGVKERVTRDLAQFRESREWYVHLGIPYRRGYLFHGPPGCGKTTLARALASHFEMNIYLVTLAGAGMSDERLLDALNEAQTDSVLLIEDVDAAFGHRTDVGQDGGLTFSGLLNAVDGVGSQEGRVVIMTTNHRDRLDPALIRPGRVDVEQRFGLASRRQVRRMFLRFYPGEDARAGWLTARVPEGSMSVAALQGIFVSARGSPGLAVQRVLEAVPQTRGRLLPVGGRGELAS